MKQKTLWENKAFKISVVILCVIAILWSVSYMVIRNIAENKIEEVAVKKLNIPNVRVSISSGGKKLKIEAGNKKDPNSEFIVAEAKGVKPNLSDMKKSTAKSMIFDVKMSEARLVELLAKKQYNITVQNGVITATIPGGQYVYGRIFLTDNKKAFYLKIDGISSERFIDKDTLEKQINPVVQIPNNLNIDKFEYNNGFYYISGNGDISAFVK